MKSESNLDVRSSTCDLLMVKSSEAGTQIVSEGGLEKVYREKKKEKVRRVNYRLPENAVKLNAAINALSQNKSDPNAPKDIRHVSKMFKIPYNTLRDNYLRQTVGELVLGKRARKQDAISNSEKNDAESR